MAPTPCRMRPSGLLAVTAGSFCRSDPAAVFLRFTNGGLPACSPRSFGRREGVVETEQPYEVADRREAGRDAVADLLGRRVRCAQVGVFLLELAELAQQRVEFRVRDDRGVEHLIPVVVLGNLFCQIGVAMFGLVIGLADLGASAGAYAGFRADLGQFQLISFSHRAPSSISSGISPAAALHFTG